MSVDPARPPDPPLSGEDNRARELSGIWGIYGAAIAFNLFWGHQFTPPLDTGADR